MAVVLREHDEMWQDDRKDRGKARLPINNVVSLPVGKQLQPELAKKQTDKLEFPYDDLYLLYDYMVKEMAIKDPFNPSK
jgi:hypothetical protein